MAKVIKDHLDLDMVYSELIVNGHFTEEELQLVCDINGYSIQTLNDCCRARFAEDIEDVLGLSTEEDEENDDLDLDLDLIYDPDEDEVEIEDSKCEDSKCKDEDEGWGPKEHRCVICKKKFFGFGNNPWPVKEKGCCCDECNETKVIPARLGELYSKKGK